MNPDFAKAMRLSLQQTRASDPLAATRTIQQALAGRAKDAARDTAGATPARRLRSDDQIEAAEVLETTPPPRRTFRDVIRAQIQRPAGSDPRQGPAAPDMAVPEGASFRRATHATPHGSRAYYLYTPSPAAGPVNGVVMMLHGCTQSAQDFATGTAMNRHAEGHGLVVIYPEQPRGANQNLCWNWFRPSDQSAGAGEPEILADLARTVTARTGAPEDRIFVAGLSAGGAMAAILGRAYPQVFAAVGVHSGLPSGAASDMISAFAAMRGERIRPAEGAGLPTIVFHGLSDRTVAPVNGRAVAGTIRNAVTRKNTVGGKSATVTTGTSPDGHAVALWEIAGGGHIWFGGDGRGSHTDPNGPDASAEMVRFFLQQP